MFGKGPTRSKGGGLRRPPVTPEPRLSQQFEPQLDPQDFDPASIAEIAEPSYPSRDPAPEMRAVDVTVAPVAPAPETAARPERKSSSRGEEFYAIKADVFAALVEAMDMTRIAQLDRSEAVREISAISEDIIAVKNHVMSTNEQRELIGEICDDVLGFGPLESLLERDDIADIMVNGSGDVFIETGGRIERTEISFRDNSQLLEICQRMVSKVGRRVDEASPICDARLLDGSRVNVIAPPLAIDGPALTIRKFKKDKLKMSDLISFASISPEGARVLEIAAQSRCEHRHLWRNRFR